MLTRFVLPARSVARGGLRLFCALALPLVIAVFAPIAQNASAKAPPLATTVLNAEALLAPDYDAAPVAVIPQGTEVELTGGAAPGFPVSLVCITTVRPFGFPRSTSHSAFDRVSTPALPLPTPHCSMLPCVTHPCSEIVLEGQAVILTGASVDGYDAASHEGTGGWINERDLPR